MSDRATHHSLTRSSMSRAAPAPINDEDLHVLARAVYRDRGWLCVRIDDLKNEIDRAFIESLGRRLYGERTRG